MEKKNKCLKCRYLWIPIKNPKNVRVCPRCKSYSWNIPRIRDKKDSIWDGNRVEYKKLTKIGKKKEKSKKKGEKDLYVKGKSWEDVAEESGFF